jgi:hypothetical protein
MCRTYSAGIEIRNLTRKGGNMSNETKRFADRFSALFESGGLLNAKFFVRRSSDIKMSDFVDDVNKMNDTISAGDFRVVEKIDTSCEVKRFDAAF